MTYSITWDKKTVYFKFSDEVSGQELVECNMKLYGNPGFDDIKLQVFDLLEVTKITLSPADVKEVAAYDRAATKINSRVKCAIVSTDQLALELAEIYLDEIHASTWEGKAFRSLSEALAWVG